MKRMTKLLAVLAVGAVAAAGVAGLAACGEKGTSGTAEGEYSYANSYNPTGAKYGIKVEVTAKNGKITKVEVLESDYVSVTDSWGDKAIWNDGLEDLLAEYEGVSVDEILKLEVACNDKGEPLKKDDEGFVKLEVGDANLLITDATQGSARLVLAVQDALENLQAEQEAE